MGDRRLKPGDVVEVRAPAEILATLDSEASIESMPFMPEMLQYAGKRFTVTRRVEKICDTVSGGPARSLRMRDTVCSMICAATARLTEAARPGAGSTGRKSGFVPSISATSARLATEMLSPNSNSSCATRRLQCLATSAPVESYRCQATEAMRATEPLSSRDIRQYLRSSPPGT